MELTHAYLAGPGCCATCGTSDPTLPIVDLQVRDLGVMNRRYRMYLCGNCALQAGTIVARAMGKAVVPTADALEVQRFHDERDAAVNRAAELEDVVRQFRAAYDSVQT